SGCGESDTLICSAAGCEREPPPPDPGPSTAPTPMERFGPVVQTRKNELRACYDRSRATNPDLKGTAYIDFVIDLEGRVTRAAVFGTTLHDQTLEACLIKVFEQLQFPPRDVPTHVSYPVQLKP